MSTHERIGIVFNDCLLCDCDTKLNEWEMILDEIVRTMCVSILIILIIEELPCLEMEYSESSLSALMKETHHAENEGLSFILEWYFFCRSIFHKK